MANLQNSKTKPNSLLFLRELDQVRSIVKNLIEVLKTTGDDEVLSMVSGYSCFFINFLHSSHLIYWS